MNTIMVQRLRLSLLSQDDAERRRLKLMWSESCQSKAQYELMVESRVAQSDVTHNLLIITNTRELSAGTSKAPNIPHFHIDERDAILSNFLSVKVELQCQSWTVGLVCLSVGGRESIQCDSPALLPGPQAVLEGVQGRRPITVLSSRHALIY